MGLRCLALLSHKRDSSGAVEGEGGQGLGHGLIMRQKGRVYRGTLGTLEFHLIMEHLAVHYAVQEHS